MTGIDKPKATPHHELIREYREKCATLEKDMLNWKDAALRLREALVLILPLAKGYAAVNPVGSNTEYIKCAVDALNIMDQNPVDEVYEAARTEHDIKVRGCGRDLFEPRSISVSLSERPTDDEIISLHEFLRGWNQQKHGMSRCDYCKSWRSRPCGEGCQW